MPDQKLEELVQAIVEIRIKDAVNTARKALKAGVPPLDVLKYGLSKGLTVIGEKYETGEYFLGELMMAGVIANDIINILESHLKAFQFKGKGNIVIGTVEGDLHDIGKNIVISLLLANGFEVHDLGINVSSDKFVQSVKKIQPDVLGMSALLTTTSPKMKEVIDQLTREGLRDKIKIIIGGAVVSQKFALDIGADAYAENAVIAVNKIRELIERGT